MHWCPDCRGYIVTDAGCQECRRRRAWGAILTGLGKWMPFDLPGDGRGVVPSGEGLEVLAAVAFLMQDRQALLHAHRAEMNTEIQAGQRAARDAYDSGHYEGRIEGASER